ncbi:hypothetical protein PFISCL1PPCAC_11289, partial [Pristionchus fissidentatus]
VTDASKSTAFAIKLSCKYPIFLLPVMQSRSYFCGYYVEKYCAELGKYEMVFLLDSLRVPLNGCKLYLDSTLTDDRAGECLDLVEACYAMLKIEMLAIMIWQPLPEMDLLANKIALDIKPHCIDLRMELTTPSLS